MGKSWKYQTKDDIELLVKVFKQENIANFLSNDTAEIDRNSVVKILKEKMDVFCSTV
jgi:phosphorylcholine metabolism protein LicD